MITLTLVLVGAVNWGLIGLINLNLVSTIFGFGALSQLVYILVGASAVYEIVMHKDSCKDCEVLLKGRSSKKKR